MAPPGEPLDDVAREYDEIDADTTKTTEEVCIMRDDLRKALAALQEYVSTHANAIRNQRILDMVLLEGHSLEEAAKAVGCSAPVASYIVRSAQRFVRESLGYQR